MVYSQDHRAAANITERSLHRCLNRKALIVPFPTEKNNILGLTTPMKQFPNWFIAPLPTAVRSKRKAADRVGCAIGSWDPLCEMSLNL